MISVEREVDNKDQINVYLLCQKIVSFTAHLMKMLT